MAALQRTSLRTRFGWILLLAVVWLAPAPSAPAQVSSPARSRAAHAAVSSDASDDAAITAAGGARNQSPRAVNPRQDALRQKAIVDDTAQLLQLAQQLKAAVDSSDQDHLSLKIIDTAGQIEKLAKTVKKKMRDAD
ncbi:MAG TPA: hypothetical protein VHU89_16285 [Acidobacteriaceae bacterium]|jgi:erythromycin esterase-like protein|nr:hypothetical protein [Acidobacteriaceae bacterium]